jgi:hypothetical protein
MLTTNQFSKSTSFGTCMPSSAAFCKDRLIIQKASSQTFIVMASSSGPTRCFAEFRAVFHLLIRSFSDTARNSSESTLRHSAKMDCAEFLTTGSLDWRTRRLPKISSEAPASVNADKNLLPMKSRIASHNCCNAISPSPTPPPHLSHSQTAQQHPLARYRAPATPPRR